MSFQTPGGPAAKRRRIEAANATLRKPFKSPLISRQQNQSGTKTTLESPSASHSVPATVSTPQTSATPAPVRSQRHAPPSAGASPLSTAPILPAGDTPELKRSTNLNLSLSRSLKATAGAASPGEHQDEGSDLLHRILASQREMQSRLRETQKRLDLVRQARRIEQASFAKRPGEPVDAELRELVEKWKRASRLAAEDLFGLIKERVEGMGGAKAWREGRKRQRGGGFYGGFGDEERSGRDRGGEEEGEGAGEEEDAEGGSGTAGLKEEEEESEETSLNIDPDVLGYDPAEDKWRD
ncbi:hypothetical protein C8A03DRAFT_41059 [Achaetomium macrosporum]|uniref:Swi5-dependent recombination DNA repair protein 1 n=1 Tax=Achaetomium macrosporum TaxID=79813 RepID=A0AAN7H9M9_9PEZI|nr:hypothetical protein C8A03DRAFT_41059 [Achaetomium macrosporum]